MKKTKKMLALVLALVMAFAMMAVTASAFDAEEHNHECAACCADEGVMPLYVALKCPLCNGVAEMMEYPDGKGGTIQKLVCLSGCGSW